jgi:hypothetical protein
MPRERKSQKGLAKTSPNSTPNARAPTKAKKRKASAANAVNANQPNPNSPRGECDGRFCSFALQADLTFKSHSDQSDLSFSSSSRPFSDSF